MPTITTDGRVTDSSVTLQTCTEAPHRPRAKAIDRASRGREHTVTHKTWHWFWWSDNFKFEPLRKPCLKYIAFVAP